MQTSLVMEIDIQRRNTVRYKLNLPVIFSWSEGGEERTAAGFTHDVALDGVLIQSVSVCPPVGCPIKIEVLMPSPDKGPEQLRIECQGTVTRVRAQNGSTCFGVRGFFDDDHITRQIVA